MQLSEDSLRAGDLKHLVSDIFEIDSYKSKMGNDEDIIVLSFTVDSFEAAEDMVTFLEKGYDAVLDADMSPGELENGKYLVFVEIERNHEALDTIIRIIYGLQKLTSIEQFLFRYYKNFKSKELSLETLKKEVPITPEKYKQKVEKKKMENYQLFFSKSLVESISMSNNDVIQFTKVYAQPISFKVLDAGPTPVILENTKDRIAVTHNDLAEVMFLTKYIGNYNITKLGNKFILENNGSAILLEKI